MTETRTSSEGIVRVIFPSGMLGSGFPEDLIYRGIEMGATAITIDGGSTDSGPHYLGSGTAKSAASAVERDLRVLLVAAVGARIPLVVGSCGTAGTDGVVDWVADMAERIAKDEGLTFTLARIYSELDPDDMVRALDAGKVRPLPPNDQVDAETLRSCEHIVGLMGHEPIVAAIQDGADVVLAGRATDTAMVAAIALMHGMPAGPTWHAAKTVECGGQCTVHPQGGPGPVFVEIDQGGFTVIPLADDAAATPTSVAAHMLYENADPFRLTEPTGVLDTSFATYRPIDSRTVRVEGSRFEEVPPTIKLEGSRLAGYETLSFVGIRDPHVLGRIQEWLDSVDLVLRDRARSALGLRDDEYRVEFRCYGLNAILGSLETDVEIPHEVGVLLKVRAKDQATATAIAMTANVLLLHMPLSGMDHLPSFAFVTSPAEIERGPAYEFVLNHVVEVADGSELVRTKMSAVSGA
jgi:hypothetical protein